MYKRIRICLNVQKRQIDSSRSPAKARSCFTMKESPFRSSLQPCLICALCLRFAPRCISYLQSLPSRFQSDCTGVCPLVQIWQESVDPKLMDLASQRFTMVPFTRLRCSPSLATRMTKTSKTTKQLSFSDMFLLRPAGVEVGRPSVPQAFRRNVARIQLALTLFAQLEVHNWRSQENHEEPGGVRRTRKS